MCFLLKKQINPELCYHLMEEPSFLGEPMREHVHTVLYTSLIRTETAPVKTLAHPSSHYFQMIGEIEGVLCISFDKRAVFFCLPLWGDLILDPKFCGSSPLVK